MMDKFLGLVVIVSLLTVLWASTAVAIVFLGPVPSTLQSERLFETFLSLAVAGFFTVLGLLAAHHGRRD